MEVEDSGTEMQIAEQTLQDKNHQRYMRAALDMVWQLSPLGETSSDFSMHAGGTGLGLR